MLKKITSFVFVFLLLFPLNINAKSGYITGSSVVTCNGNTYGSHSDGHYHKTEKNSAGRWIAVGGIVSKTNPCAASGGSKPESNNNSNSNSNSNNTAVPPKEKTQAQIAAEKEAQRVKDGALAKQKEEAAKLKEEEDKRLEEERLAQEEEERIAAEIEARRNEEEERIIKENLEDTSISKLTYDGKVFGSTILNFDYKKVKVESTNPNATVEVEKQDLNLFNDNKVHYIITSEDGTQSKKDSVSFFLLGTQKEFDLLKPDLIFTNSDKETIIKQGSNSSYEVSPEVLKGVLSKVSFSSNEVLVDGFDIAEDTISLILKGESYVVPYTSTTTELTAVETAVAGAVGTVGLVGGGALVLKSRKKAKNSRQIFHHK